MPIFLDRHYVEGATKNTLALAHEKDVEVQSKYDVKFLTYWFDEERSTAFCLVDAPDKAAIQNAHDEAHGDIPSEILEVDPTVVQAFLGRIADPVVDNSTEALDSAFRGIMFTDLKDSTLMTSQLGENKALHLLHIHNAITRNALRTHSGSEVKHTGDGFMASFSSIKQQVHCAIDIQKAFLKYRQQNPNEHLSLRIGLSAGEPIEEHGDLFGSSVQLAARLCAHADVDSILVSEEVKDSCQKESFPFIFNGLIQLKGFPNETKIFEVQWQDFASTS